MARPYVSIFRYFYPLLVIGGALAVFVPVRAQQFDKNQRDRGIQMLHDVADALRKHYYDPTFHGVDLAAEIKASEQKIQNANSNSEVFGAVESILEELNDSHTFFSPPPRSTRRDFGYVMTVVGDKCYVTSVRPNTDAAEKLAPGDQVVTFQGFQPTRETLWTLNYAFNTLYAVTAIPLEIVRPDGTQKTVQINAKIRQEKRVLDLTSNGEDIWKLIQQQENAEHLMRQRLAEFGDALIIWKMPEFDMTEDEVDRALRSVKRHQTLILDLRGNPGGAVRTLEYLVGGVMDHDVTIATRTGRKTDLKPMLAKKHGSPFSGKLIVLVDSRSASAAELFAHTVQLEHRGTVLGDLSMGAVMESRHYSMSDGANTKIYYGASITDADLIMKDGKSLEHTGVTPDEIILPTAADLAAGRDPVISKAALLAGLVIDPAAAGKLFPYEWRKD